MSKKYKHQNFENWSPDKKPKDGDGGAKVGVNLDTAVNEKHQFATRTRANDFARLMRTLPDPDPILRKMGRGITALQELLADSHLESVWSVRCSTISGAQWFVQAGGEEGRREKEAAEVYAAQLSALDIPRVIEEIMDAVAFGYSPLEILWRPEGSYWGIEDIVGKPPQWFEFNNENRLVFKTGAASTEELPPNRFLIARHRPSYANPYGVKVFSKCYWPCMFKKNGFRWWTVFVEKYGGAFLHGKYPSNASEQYKSELLEALEAMVADAVAIIPEGAEIEIEGLSNKGSISTVHKEYIDAANAEISKAVLGQTLTTEIGGKGSYAAAQAHNVVRGDLSASDRRRVSECFNRLAAVWTAYNFGAEVSPPKFEFVKDEDLQGDRAERDTKLYTIGWRPKKSYIVREYEIPEEDFELQHQSGAGDEAPAAHHAFHAPARRSFCECGNDTKSTMLQKLYASLFSSKEEKKRQKDTRIMNEFKNIMLEAGQEELDGQIERYADALGTAENFDGALPALLSTYNKNDYGDFASLVDEVRFVGQCLGGSRGKRK